MDNHQFRGHPATVSSCAKHVDDPPEKAQVDREGHEGTVRARHHGGASEGASSDAVGKCEYCGGAPSVACRDRRSLGVAQGKMPSPSDTVILALLGGYWQVDVANGLSKHNGARLIV